MIIDVNLNELICDNLVQVSKDIINCEVGRAVLKGGRSSTKSQVISEDIVVGCMANNASAVCCVKYANKLEDRLVNTFRRSISYMGVERFWKLRRSPFEYVLLDENGNETNHSIKFTGADDPESLKSFSARDSGFRYVWFEEATNFNSLKEVNTLIQTFARGKGKHTTIFSYNPPMSTSSWVNKEFNNITGEILDTSENNVYTEFEFEVAGVKKKSRQVINHSSYLDVIASGHADWLGEIFIAEAEKSKVENEKYYRWAYLGEVIGTDANVFHNIRDWDGNTDSLSLTEIMRGLDWGMGGPDPSSYCGWYYDRRNNCIYALDEYYKSKVSVDVVASKIKEFNKHNFPVQCESAAPILNNQLRNKGINALDVKKGPDSVRAGIKWLQSLNGIYINKYRTPNIYREFTGYEYVIDKDDTITDKLSDKDNHTIDATRYAFVYEIKLG